MKKTILGILALLTIEGFIISAMLLLPIPIPVGVKVLDIVILSIILWLFGYDLIRPLVDTDKKNPTEVGSLGIRWSGQLLYSVLAVSFAVIAAVCAISLTWQILIQSLFLAILFITFFFSLHASDQVQKIADKEDQVIAGRDKIRIAVTQIHDEVTIQTNLPEYVRMAVNEMEEKAQFISPSNKSEAIAYEAQFAEVASRVCSAMSNFKINEDTIRQDLMRLQRILDNRKKVRS